MHKCYVRRGGSSTQKSHLGVLQYPSWLWNKQKTSTVAYLLAFFYVGDNIHSLQLTNITNSSPLKNKAWETGNLSFWEVLAYVQWGYVRFKESTATAHFGIPGPTPSRPVAVKRFRKPATRSFQLELQACLLKKGKKCEDKFVGFYELYSIYVSPLYIYICIIVSEVKLYVISKLYTMKVVLFILGNCFLLTFCCMFCLNAILGYVQLSLIFDIQVCPLWSFQATNFAWFLWEDLLCYCD